MKPFAICILTAAVTLMITNVYAEEQQPRKTNPVVVMKTSKGTIEIELFSDRAPETVTNFLSYVLQSFYDGTVFHRVMEGFMIQGGGFTPDMVEKPTLPPIKNEAANKLSNKRGTIAMARMPMPHSATCQFFINHKDNAGLDHKNTTPKGYGYCVFGRVIKGMDVIDKIAQVGTITYNHPQKGQMGNVPVKTILIESVRVKK